MLLRISAAAKYTGFSTETLKDYVLQGIIPVVVIKKERRFRQEDLDRLMQPVNMADPEQQRLRRNRELVAVKKRNKLLRSKACGGMADD